MTSDPARSGPISDISARQSASLFSSSGSPVITVRKDRWSPLWQVAALLSQCDCSLFGFLAFEFEEVLLKTPILRIVRILLPKVFTIVYLCECYFLRFGILWGVFLLFFSFFPFFLFISFAINTAHPDRVSEGHWLFLCFLVITVTKVPRLSPHHLLSCRSATSNSSYASCFEFYLLSF